MKAAFEEEPEYKTLVSRIEEISVVLGKRPRLMIAKLGQDGHDRGAKVIASAFGDFGFEVVAGPLFQTPQEAADMTLATKVHVIGASSLAAGHKTRLPQLVQALRAKGAENIIVVCGGRGVTPGLSVPDGLWCLGPEPQCSMPREQSSTC